MFRRPAPGRLLRPHLRDVRPLLWLAAGLVLAGAGWIAATGLMARSELSAVQVDLKTLRGSLMSPPGATSAAGRKPGGRELAEWAARSAAQRAGRAHRLTTGPAWYLAAQLPLVGGPLRTVRGTTDALDRLAGRALPAVVRSVDHLSTDTGGGHIDLAGLRRAGPDLEHAATEVTAARAEVDGLPRQTWSSTVDRVRGRLAGTLGTMAPAMENAAAGARLLPPMLGEDGMRRYLLVFQNPAEARGTGGMPGAYAVLTADGGRLALPEFGRDTDMATARPGIDLGADFAAMYAHYDAVNTWANSNMSPHFPYAARIWSAAWARKSGERVDGVLSLGPGSLAGLLAAVGPARTADGVLVTARNVVDLTERTNYAMYRDSVRRKAFLLDVARTAAGRLLAAAGDPRQRPVLLRSLYEVLSSGDMTAWSAHAPEERELAARPVGGSVPQGPRPYAGLVLNNAAGTKLDYYLDRSLEWSSDRCTAAGREVTVKAVLSNRAPSAGLPPYVTDRLDKPAYKTHEGDNRLLLSYFGTTGARLTEATVDGRRVLVSPGTERGHPVYTLDVEVPVGGRRTVTLHLLEPVSDQPPTVLRQRLSRPMRVTVRPGAGCPVDGA
ncbi:DUF4012 domain-containing protein [Streptomyces tropicalis]|uniref:DUF4012 domain-containing protein n=1 Tax=Streptomyces tropicalis TaxID=3034234 RepID=A0ABT5ZZ03_9ACTN|nr:DUF4012 domain-containing protein [Streptomyces tropicalis]MDF3297619.1 DUF4012 domain-containing protein [Streptomyces tropicalis]